MGFIKTVLAAGIILSTLFGVQLTAQTTSPSPTFDVASVKAATPPTPNANGFIRMSPPTGGPGTKDPGRINYPNVTLKYLLLMAYDVKNFQIVGPPFIDTERFDVTATMPPDTTKAQFQLMLQNLLATRFKLAVHRDSKDLPMYSLVVAKGGPKLQASVEKPGADPETAPLPPPPDRLRFGPDGLPIIPTGGRPGFTSVMMPGRARMAAVQQTMQDLANRLTTQLNLPVTDNTGLTGKYDFTLTFAPETTNGPGNGMTPPPPPPPGASGGVMVAAPPPGSPGAPPSPDSAEPMPTLFAALQAQLGLKIEARRGPVETIVIDHVEKTPTEN